MPVGALESAHAFYLPRSSYRDDGLLGALESLACFFRAVHDAGDDGGGTAILEKRNLLGKSFALDSDVLQLPVSELSGTRNFRSYSWLFRKALQGSTHSVR